jgi:hypothetical protein
MAFRVVVRNPDVDGGVEELFCESMEDASGEDGTVVLHIVHPDHTIGLARTIRREDIISSVDLDPNDVEGPG